MMSRHEAQGKLSITLNPLEGMESPTGLQLLAGGTCRACRVEVRDSNGVLIQRKLPRNPISMTRVALNFSRTVSGPITLFFHDNDRNGALAVDDIRLSR